MASPSPPPPPSPSASPVPSHAAPVSPTPPQPQTALRLLPRFLPPRTYRQRRVADAARILPFAVAILFVLPVLRGDGPSPGPGTGMAQTAVYLFLAWAAAVAATFVLSRRLARHDGGSAPDDRPGTTATARAEASAERGPPSTGPGGT